MPSTKVALVTAASQGLGAACARELAAQGYAVALLARSPAVLTLAAELGGVATVGSVTDEADVQSFVQQAISTYGRIDAVVINTGHPAKGELLSIPDQAWHDGLDLLVLHVARIARAVTPLMVQQGGGALVNISTFAAFEPKAAFPVSSVLRAALAGWTKLYADQYAAANIRMNNLLPGYMDNYPISDDIRAAIPMGRNATTAEVARVAAFLVSDAASYLTGQNIRVDGGLTRSL